MGKASSKELKFKLTEATKQVEVGGTYTHYKDETREYVVKDLVIIEATEEVGVVYEAQYGDALIFMRPLSNWQERVEIEGNVLERFKKKSLA